MDGHKQVGMGDYADDWMQWLNSDAVDASMPLDDFQGDMSSSKPLGPSVCNDLLSHPSLEQEVSLHGPLTPFTNLFNLPANSISPPLIDNDGYTVMDLDSTNVGLEDQQTVSNTISTQFSRGGLAHQPDVGSSQWCTCMACNRVGVTEGWHIYSICRVEGCTFTTDDHGDYITHERDHYFDSNNGRFRCTEHQCKFTTKRWPDLVRHNTVRHCLTPPKFQCPVPYCKYSGDKGFSRKDKLKSHMKNVHKDEITSKPAGKVRAIRPAIQGGHVSTPGAGPSSSLTSS